MLRLKSKGFAESLSRTEDGPAIQVTLMHWKDRKTVQLSVTNVEIHGHGVQHRLFDPRNARVQVASWPRYNGAKFERMVSQLGAQIGAIERVAEQEGCHAAAAFAGDEVLSGLCKCGMCEQSVGMWSCTWTTVQFHADEPDFLETGWMCAECIETQEKLGQWRIEKHLTRADAAPTPPRRVEA